MGKDDDRTPQQEPPLPSNSWERDKKAAGDMVARIKQYVREVADHAKKETFHTARLTTAAALAQESLRVNNQITQFTERTAPRNWDEYNQLSDELTEGPLATGRDFEQKLMKQIGDWETEENTTE